MRKKSEEQNQNEYEIIHEKIVSKKENKMNAFLKRISYTVLFAALFGVVAGLMFAFTEKFLMDRFGINGTLYQLISLNRPNTTIRNDNDGGNTVGNQSGGQEGNTTAVPQITIELEDPTQTELPDPVTEGEMAELQSLYNSIRKYAKQAEKSMVQISAIIEGVDWFEETYETQKDAAGLYVGATDQEMLFLVSLDSIEGVTKLEVILENGTVVSGSLYSYDTNYRIGVVAVAMASVKGIDKKYLPEKAEFVAGGIHTGTPVYVLGNPNGHAGAIEVGMITGTNGLVQITDDSVVYFTTNVTRYLDGDGFVFSMDGKVLGIVSAALNNGENTVFSAASIEGIRGEIDRLLNRKSRVFCGIHVETVSAAVKDKYNVPSGVYVTEVLTSSPALAAGLKAGDIILKVGKTEVKNVEEFHKVLNSISSGKNYTVTVSREASGGRKNQEITIAVEYRAH